MPFDIIVVGGSLTGLLAAREIGKAGFSVKIFEEHPEIGLPEKCDGLVSRLGGSSLGVPLTNDVVQNQISKAIFFSPSGKRAELNASRQKVLVLNRRMFDKAIGQQALDAGASLVTSSRVSSFLNQKDEAKVKGKFGIESSAFVVDATGYSSLVPVRRRAALQGGKYIVRGSWFDRNSVELYFDNHITPGFFRWVIPINEELAKVGAAGDGINPFKVLDRFVEEKRARPVSKVAGPVVVSGPRESFVDRRIIMVGDAAGQTKPTTGGGIYSGGSGGVLAGNALAKALTYSDFSPIRSYELQWRSKFGREFASMRRVRILLRQLDNELLDRMFAEAIDSGVFNEISTEGDFDFHLSSVLKILGLRRVSRLLGSYIAKRLVSGFGI